MQYRFFSNGFKKRCDFPIEFIDVVYDDVVDRSQFRPDSENIRNQLLSNSGVSAIGSYDDPDNPPDDIEVSIRTGKFDKVEVNNIMRSKIIDWQKENSNKKADELKKQVESVSKARQDYLDKMTGFKGMPVEG